MRIKLYDDLPSVTLARLSLSAKTRLAVDYSPARERSKANLRCYRHIIHNRPLDSLHAISDRAEAMRSLAKGERGSRLNLEKTGGSSEGYAREDHQCAA